MSATALLATKQNLINEILQSVNLLKSTQAKAKQTRASLSSALHISTHAHMHKFAYINMHAYAQKPLVHTQ